MMSLPILKSPSRCLPGKVKVIEPSALQLCCFNTICNILMLSIPRRCGGILVKLLRSLANLVESDYIPNELVRQMMSQFFFGFNGDNPFTHLIVLAKNMSDFTCGENGVISLTSYATWQPLREKEALQKLDLNQFEYTHFRHTIHFKGWGYFIGQKKEFLIPRAYMGNREVLNTRANRYLDVINIETNIDFPEHFSFENLQSLYDFIKVNKHFEREISFTNSRIDTVRTGGIGSYSVSSWVCSKSDG